MTIKYFIALLLLVSAISSTTYAQKKRKQVKEVKTDTILVFNQLEDENFSERNVYWPEKGEMTLIYRQMYNDPNTWDEEYMLYFTVLFPRWDSIQTDTVYNVTDFLVDCEIKGVFGGYDFETPTGQITFKAKADNRLTFQFDAQALSKDKSKLLVFRGVREFVPDY